MYLLIFVRLQAERRISFVKGSLAFMTGVHSKVATIMKETESGTRCGRRTMYVSCRFIASGSISVMRYNNNNNNNSALIQAKLTITVVLVRLSVNNNIVIEVKSGHTATELKEQEAVWKHLIPGLKEVIIIIIYHYAFGARGYEAAN